MKRWRGQFRKGLHDLQWIDALAGGAFGAVAGSAVLRWPDKTIADVTFPTAFLILFLLWRRW